MKEIWLLRIKSMELSKNVNKQPAEQLIIRIIFCKVRFIKLYVVCVVLCWFMNAENGDKLEDIYNHYFLQRNYYNPIMLMNTAKHPIFDYLQTEVNIV